MTWAATQPTWSDPSGKSPLTYLVQPVWRIVFDCICVSLEEDWFSSLKKPSALPSAYIRWRDIQIERTTEYTKSVGKRQEMMNPVKEQVISGIDPFSHEDRIFNLTTATWPTIRRKKIDMLPSRSCLYHSFSWGRDMTTISGCVKETDANELKGIRPHIPRSVCASSTHSWHGLPHKPIVWLQDVAESQSHVGLTWNKMYSVANQ